MSEWALYRKYRSGNFAEVIGQDHVVRTLTAALESGRLRHAYLFTGPRGVGKTSVARLLARALNCTGQPRPCNQCANCQAAQTGSLDIIEIDAASNRSIDAVRDLRDKIHLAPSVGQYKVYIIDEVHMLTTEAFNALLKTLEEPPAHVVFILATTEAHKLPETIISRTQAFHFKAIGLTDLAAQLGSIATAEGLSATPEALEAIATAARGSFRDAISLLDQLSATGTEITVESTRDLLGYSPHEEIAALSRALASRDTAAALTVTTRLEASGAQAGLVATQLAEAWRRLLLTVTGATPAPDQLTAELAESVTATRAAEVAAGLIEATRSSWPQLALEAALVRLTATPAPETPSARSAEVVAKTPTKSSPAPDAPAPAPPSHSEDAPSTTTSDLWPKVLLLMKAQNNSLAALLQMYPVEFTATEVTIKPRFNFHRDLFLKAANRTLIEAALAKVYGRSMKFSAQTVETGKNAKPTRRDQTAELVTSALEILGGEVIE